MKRSKRQLAKVRQSQTTPPLTPMSMTAPAPAPKEPGETPEAYQLRLDTDARVFGLKLELAWAEKDYRKSLAAMQEETKRLRSRCERAEQEVLVTRIRMSAMLQVHYADNIKRGIKNGDLIVTQPKTHKTQEFESETEPCQQKNQ